MKRPTRYTYTVQPDYRGNYLVVGPSGFVKKYDGESAFVEAHGLAERMNEHHDHVQSIAANVLRERFGLLLPGLPL